MRFKAEEVEVASPLAIAVARPGARDGYILERQPDGGLIGDRSILTGACLFPISMVRSGSLEAGDWTVVPYVHDFDGNPIETEAEYFSFTVEIVEGE